jgi:hypothetical protein
MQDVGTHAEARGTTPSGSSPVLVKRQSAIRSFRASATPLLSARSCRGKQGGADVGSLSVASLECSFLADRTS